MHLDVIVRRDIPCTDGMGRLALFGWQKIRLCRSNYVELKKVKFSVL